MVFLILLVTSIVADITDCVLYWRYAAEHDGPGLYTLWSYLRTPWGATLTLLGLAPWLLLLLYVSVLLRRTGDAGSGAS